MDLNNSLWQFWGNKILHFRKISFNLVYNGEAVDIHVADWAIGLLCGKEIPHTYLMVAYFWKTKESFGQFCILDCFAQPDFSIPNSQFKKIIF